MPDTPVNPTPPPDQAAQTQAPSIPLSGNGHLERLIRVELQVAQLTDTFNESKKDNQATIKDIDGLKDDIKALDKKIDILESKMDAKFDALESKMDTKFDAFGFKINVRTGLMIAMLAAMLIGYFFK